MVGFLPLPAIILPCWVHGGRFALCAVIGILGSPLACILCSGSVLLYISSLAFRELLSDCCQWTTPPRVHVLTRRLEIEFCFHFFFHIVVSSYLPCLGAVFVTQCLFGLSYAA